MQFFSSYSAGKLGLCGLLAAAFVFGATAHAAAKAEAADTSNATTTAQFIVDRPTLISLGFEWRIQGDANHNAKVELEYRKKG